MRAFDWLGQFLSSPFMTVLGGLATIIGVYPLVVYVLRPLRVRRNDVRAATLRNERSYLHEALQDLDRIDASTYWHDRQYTPLAAAEKPFAPVPPEFLLLSERRGSWLNVLASDRTGRRSTDLARLLQKHRNPVVILGDPGAGKSVAIRHTIRRLIHRALRWYVVRPLLPLYVPCSYYTATVGSEPASVESFLVQYVKTTYVAFRDGRLDFADYLKNGRFCIFFDALDEMPRIDYADRVARLREFANRYSFNRVHFSCRVLDYDARLQVAEVRIRPFDDVRRRRFLTRGLRPHFTAREVRKLRYRIETDGRLADLVSNPFFAQLVVFYVRATKLIPSNRYQLLSLFVKKRLEVDESRIANIAGDVGIERLLGPLAYEMATRKGIGTSLPVQHALECITRHGISDEYASRALNAATETGLLALSTSGSLVHFSHHRLQEYFAAVYAVSETKLDAQSVAAYADDQWWREILIMMAGIEGPDVDVGAILVDSAVAVTRETLEQASEMRRSALERASTAFDLTETCVEALRGRLDLDEEVTESPGESQVRRLIAVIASSQAVQRDARRYENARRYGRRVSELLLASTNDCIACSKALQPIAKTMNSFDGKLSGTKRLVVNRCAVALACMSAGAITADDVWARLRSVTMAIADSGDPPDQMKMVRELIAFDEDAEIAVGLRRLYSTTSSLVRGEVFRSLLRYRIPHVGFDRRTIRYLWNELAERGSSGTMITYLPQLIRSFVRVKALSVAGGLAAAHLALISMYIGGFPLLNYRMTWMPKWKFVLRPDYVLPAIGALVVIALMFDLLRVRKIRAMAAGLGLIGAAVIWSGSVEVNAVGAGVPTTTPPPDNLFMKLVGVGIALLVAAHVLIVAYSWLVDGVRMFRMSRLKRSIGRRLATGQLGTGIIELADEYRACTSGAAKQLVIGLMQHCADPNSEQYLSVLTALAQAENDGQLRDALWNVVNDVEMQAARMTPA